MDFNCRGASTGKGWPGTASGPHHRCPRGATPNPNIGIDCVPALGRNLFSVKQASRNGVVSIFDKHNPRLEADNFALPLQEFEDDPYFFSLDLVSGSSAPKLAIQAAANATLWHRRMGPLNRKRLDLLKKVNNNGVGFDGTVPDCDVSPWGKAVNGPTPRQPTNTSSALSIWSSHI